MIRTISLAAVIVAGVAAVLVLSRQHQVPAEPEPYWVTVVSCEDTPSDQVACVMFDQDTWTWYPRGMANTGEPLAPGRWVNHPAASTIDVNVSQQ